MAGLAHFLSLMYWLVYTMGTYGHLPWYLSIGVLFLLSCYLAIYVSVFSYALVRLCRTPQSVLVCAPLFWTALEYARSFLFTGFPWQLVGYSQYRAIEIIQTADLFGVYGVSFLVVFSNAAVSLAILSLLGRNWQGREISKLFAAVSASALVLCIASAWMYGTRRIETVQSLTLGAESARVAVIQGNIEQAIKWDRRFQDFVTDKYILLSEAAGKESPDLIVWPETATPFYLGLDAEPSLKVIRGIADIGIDFIVGSPYYVARKGGADYYNRAYLVRADGSISAEYDKVHLVPFGEYVPLKRYLFFLGKMVAEVGDFKPGRKGQTLPWRGNRIGMLICYEIIFPNLSREMAGNGATFLVNITNDAWFGTTSGPFQHFSMAVFRAVENRRFLVRAANTGISGFIDPAGRTVSSTRLFEDAVEIRQVPQLSQKSVYTRFGDVFAIGCLILSLLWAGYQIGMSRSRRT